MTGIHIRICEWVEEVEKEDAEGNKYKETVDAVAKRFRGTPFSFVWFEGTSQPVLEEAHSSFAGDGVTDAVSLPGAGGGKAPSLSSSGAGGTAANIAVPIKYQYQKEV